MGSASSNKSSQSGSGFNLSDALSIASSFNQSDSRSTSENFGTSQSGSFVDKAQQPFLNALYNQNRAATNVDAGAGADNVNRQTSGGLMSDFRSLGGLTDWKTNVGDQGSELRKALGEQLTESILPGVRGQSIAAGGFGGGRQGVAEGIASQGVSRAYGAGLADIFQRAQGTALDAAGARSGLAGGMQQQAGAGIQARMNQLLQSAGILGGPTILQRAGSQSGGVSDSTSTARGGSSSFSSTRSRGGYKTGGKSGGWGFGIG